MKNILSTIALCACVLALCGGVGIWIWNSVNSGMSQSNTLQTQAYSSLSS